MEAGETHAAIQTSEALVANALRCGAAIAIARAIPRTDSASNRAITRGESAEALALAVFEALAMAAALGGCAWTGILDGTVRASETIVACASTGFCALALTTAILGACQRLHAIMAREASKAAAELTQGASSMTAALGWARVRCVQDGDIVVALGCQLAATKCEHPATHEDSAMALSRKPRNHIRGSLTPSHVDGVEAPNIVVALWAGL